MKRLLTLCLSALLVCALFGCGGKNAEAPSTNSGTGQGSQTTSAAPENPGTSEDSPDNVSTGSPVGEDVTLSSFEGKWYSYIRNTWIIIEGNTYTEIDTKTGDEFTGECELSDGVLSLNGDGYESMLTFRDDGILTGEYLCHLRPQDGETPDAPPIDLSADSYLGEWHCEELGESIILDWDYAVYHVVTIDDTEYYIGGLYEPYGNRFILCYTFTDDGEEIIFNGGDAIYDQGAQTLTTAEQYVYTRVSSTGGKKLLPDDVQSFDLYDWGGPHITKEEIASKIIDVWVEYGEEADPAYLEVGSLVEAIDNSDSEHEYIFIIACEVAGIDNTSYFGAD